jgi:predicted membrane-bound spermidine synthase
MIISIALLGFGISGVYLFLNKSFQKYNSEKLLSVLSIFYALSIVLSFIFINQIPFDPFSLFTQPVQFVYLPVYYILIAFPFFFAGMIISLLLIRFKSEVSKLYFFDLTGAGIACFAFVFLMPVFGGNGTIIFISGFAFIAAIIFSYNRHNVITLFALILLILTFGLLLDTNDTVPINVSPNKSFFVDSVILSNSNREDALVLSEWNTISKIDVYKDEDESPDGYNVYNAIIDEGNATTNIPNVKSLPPKTKPADASNLAFVLYDSSEKAFIIGSAGGGEILVGLYHSIKNITAVEINGILNDLIKDKLFYWTGPLVRNNKSVKLITDDARSVITGSEDKYDVIISAHTISSSAVSSGAMSMVENYILTQEAISQYLTHLNSDGILYISRPETQIPRLISSIKKVREELSGGLEKSTDNFFVFRRPANAFERGKSYLAGIVYKKDGLSYIDVINLRNEADGLGLEVVYDPLSKQPCDVKPLIESENIDANMKSFYPDIHPATDDKPFFDNNIGFANLTWQGFLQTFSQDSQGIIALKDKPVAESTLIALFVQTVIIAFVFLFLPLIFSRKNPKKENKDKIFLFYFASLGLAFIMLQISLIQKFTLFLGQPVYTLLTVISTMLIFSGIGSLLSQKIVNNSRKRLHLIFILIAVFSILIGIFNPFIFSGFSKLALLYRVAISVVIIAPLGFFMGMPFPVGISLINDNDKKMIAFCWAFNGFFSVIGSVLAMIFAMILGFRFVFIFSAAVYIIASFLISKKILINKQ